MKHFTHLKQNLTRAAMTLLLALLTATSAWAMDYISDVMVIGGSSSETNNLKTTLTEQGWTVIEQDLNADAGGDYIYLLYKIESSSNNLNWGYITDFYISNSTGTAPDEITHNERTYHLVPYDGGTDFINSKGDLNRGAGGAYIHLYYTTDLFTDNRTVTDIYFNTTQSGAVGVNGGTTGYDLNTNAGGDYIYMHFTTATSSPILTGLGTVESPFLIGSTANWSTFTTMIQVDRGSDKYYQLTDNISITTMAGTSTNPFRGTFDGNGKTLTVNISGSEQGVAPFHYIDGATIQNLTVGGTVTGSAYHAAGLVGFCSGGTNTVTSCAVATNVSASGYGGGIVGHGLSSTLILRNSYYSGTISGIISYAGGLLGWCDAMTVTMNNCLFKGTFTPSGSGKYHPIACANHGSTVTATITDAFYLNSLTPTATGDKTIPGAEGIPLNTSFVSGEYPIPVMATDGITYYMPPITKNITIGNGNGDISTTHPFFMENDWSLVQQIYLADEIEMSGTINSIAFRRAQSSGAYSMERVQVYMKLTDKDHFDNYKEMVPLDASDKVYEGDFTATEGSDWVTITLDTPFEYNLNSNLLICTYDTVIGHYPENLNNHEYAFYVHHANRRDFCLHRNKFDIMLNYTDPYHSDPIPPDLQGEYSDYSNLSNYNYVNDIRLSITTTSYYPKPANLEVNELTDKTAVLTWEAPQSPYAIIGYAYQYKKVNDANWSPEVTVGSNTTTASLSGLSGNTTYQFRVKTLYHDGESVYNNIPFTTLRSLPYECGFENGMDGWGMVDCYFENSNYIVDYSDYNLYTGIRIFAHHDGDFGFQFDHYSNPNDRKPQYLISPEFAGTSPTKVSFYYRNDSSGWPETFQVGYSTTTSDINAFSWSNDIAVTGEDWNRYDSLPLPMGTKYVAIKYISNAYKLFVDDFSLVEYSPYAKPTNLAASNLTPQGATLTWTNPDASVTGYAYQYRQVNGAWSVEDTLSLTSVTLNGLTLNTEYDFRVKALYTENNASNYESTRFMTEGETESLPHYQSFENGMGGWRIIVGDAYTEITSNQLHEITSGLSYEGDQCFWFLGTNQYLISPQLSGNTPTLLEFYYMNYEDFLAYFQVGYSTTTKDLDAFTWSDNIPSIEMTWHRYIQSYTTCPKYIAIKFNAGVLYLDDIRILPAHFCSVTGYGEGDGGWTFIASPVEGNIVPTEVGNLVTNTASEYDLYRFNQSATKEWENYKAHSDDFVLENGKGYLYARKNSTNLAFAGTFNAGATKTVELDYDPNAEFKGWNLVGNPFPTLVVVNRSFYTMNEDGTGLNPQPVSSGGAIAACTGILVQAEGPNESVTFHNFSRETMENNGLLRIAVGNEDQAIVSFNPGDQLGKFYFGKQDANIYIPQGNKEYAIACSDGQGEMPVNFKAKKNGTYTITINPEGVEMGYLHLIDNMTGADIDLLAAKVPELVEGPTLNDVFNSVESSFSTGSTTSYTFTAKTTDYESRFKLVFSANNEDGPSMGSRTFAFVSNGEIIITGIDGDACNASLQVIDVLGHVVVCRDASNASAISTSGLTPGVYMLRLINGDDIRTQKIVIE
jgi:hypothetical protein